MPYLGSQIRDFALFIFVPERTLCARWRHSRLCFLVWWCLVRHWRRRRARGSRQRRDLVVSLFLCLWWWWRHNGRVARNSGLKFCFEQRWRCWISISLGSTGSWWFVVVAFRPCSDSMGLSVTVGCSFSAGEGLVATAFVDDLDGEDERSSANGGTSKVPLWLRVLREPRQKSTPYGFGWHPRPKTTLFCLTPICLGSRTGAEYQKQPGPKAPTALVIVTINP